MHAWITAVGSAYRQRTVGPPLSDQFPAQADRQGRVPPQSLLLHRTSSTPQLQC